MSASAAPTGVCAQCGAPFRCDMEAGDAECWCARLPPLLPLPAPADPAAPATCLCPACLRQRLSSIDAT
ncbi:cysteine-rich CWC family protein [Sulfuritalea sp.]|uniref:cysteine-rich CWC family protein n=1 Tax=Sulfuritalea sp. TaxID=2480090 RepID=UPI00391AA849